MALGIMFLRSVRLSVKIERGRYEMEEMSEVDRTSLAFTS
jgi:hypothetical protein